MEILPHAIIWRSLKDITLSEISSHKKTHTICSHLYEESKVAKLIETENERVSRGWTGEEIGSQCSMGVEFQVCRIKKF